MKMMRADDLIGRLETLRKKHGNVPVYVLVWNLVGIQRAYFSEDAPDPNKPGEEGGAIVLWPALSKSK